MRIVSVKRTSDPAYPLILIQTINIPHYRSALMVPQVTANLSIGSTSNPPRAFANPCSTMIDRSSSLRTVLKMAASSIIPTKYEPPPHLPISTGFAVTAVFPGRVPHACFFAIYIDNKLLVFLIDVVSRCEVDPFLFIRNMCRGSRFPAATGFHKR